MWLFKEVLTGLFNYLIKNYYYYLQWNVIIGNSSAAAQEYALTTAEGAMER